MTVFDRFNITVGAIAGLCGAAMALSPEAAATPLKTGGYACVQGLSGETTALAGAEGPGAAAGLPAAGGPAAAGGVPAAGGPAAAAGETCTASAAITDMSGVPMVAPGPVPVVPAGAPLIALGPPVPAGAPVPAGLPVPAGAPVPAGLPVPAGAPLPAGLPVPAGVPAGAPIPVVPVGAPLIALDTPLGGAASAPLVDMSGVKDAPTGPPPTGGPVSGQPLPAGPR